MGATDVRALQARVLAEKADLGIAFDGDGDRVIMVDHEGNKVDGDQIMYIIAREGLRQGQLRGGAVGTLMSNMGLELALKQLEFHLRARKWVTATYWKKCRRKAGVSVQRIPVM